MTQLTHSFPRKISGYTSSQSTSGNSKASLCDGNLSRSEQGLLMAHSDLRLSVVRRMKASSIDISLFQKFSNVLFFSSLNSSDQSNPFLLFIVTIKNVNGGRNGMVRFSQFDVTFSFVCLFVLQILQHHFFCLFLSKMN